jgi:hypothetical protein
VPSPPASTRATIFMVREAFLEVVSSSAAVSSSIGACVE